jgi:hypothetical protein
MHANDPQRFIVRMEIYAAAGVVDLDKEGARNPSADLQSVLSQLAKADPDEVEDQTYRQLRFDLCDACRRVLMSSPLGVCSD